MRDVALSTSGRHLASAALDGEVRIWFTATGSHVSFHMLLQLFSFLVPLGSFPTRFTDRLSQFFLYVKCVCNDFCHVGHFCHFMLMFIIL